VNTFEVRERKRERESERDREEKMKRQQTDRQRNTNRVNEEKRDRPSHCSLHTDPRHVTFHSLPHVPSGISI
jgi:hypothetical protein